MTIPFIDLKSQYRSMKPEIQARIDAVLEHGQYIMGPEVGDLKKSWRPIPGRTIASLLPVVRKHY